MSVHSYGMAIKAGNFTLRYGFDGKAVELTAAIYASQQLPDNANLDSKLAAVAYQTEIRPKISGRPDGPMQPRPELRGFKHRLLRGTLMFGEAQGRCLLGFWKPSGWEMSAMRGSHLRPLAAVQMGLIYVNLKA